MMSDTNTVIYPNSPPLLAIKGWVSVHFMDGSSVEGEFATQDQFNIFLKVDGKPRMISRVQIRYIEGKTIEQIEQDDSPDIFAERGSGLLTTPEPKIPHRERFDTEEYPVPVVQQPVIDDDDGTIVLDNVEMDQVLQASMGEDEDYDGTMVIDINKYPLGGVKDDSDDGTLVLTPDASQFGWSDEDDGTIVLEPRQAPASFEVDDRDITAVQAGSADADATMVIPESKVSERSITLICTTGPHSGDVFKLQSGINTVGRSSDNVIVLSKDKEISRRHALILQESGRFVVQDQNSLNGTFVNDEQITGPRYLEDGDEILVGLSTLKYQEG
jgi:sRNA-binding regulator protein Hfq